MKLSEYSNLVQKTGIYPRDTVAEALVYTGLGLTGEAGELANQIKKIIRDDRGELTEERRQKLIDELGDVFWYAAATARELHITVEEVLIRNSNKLLARQKANTIQGDQRDG